MYKILKLNLFLVLTSKGFVGANRVFSAKGTAEIKVRISPCELKRSKRGLMVQVKFLVQRHGKNKPRT